MKRITKILRRKVTPSIQEKLSFLLKSQYWPLEKLKEYQWSRVQELLTHSYENVSYYRMLLKSHDLKPDDIKSFEDLKKIPILTKRNIQENTDKLISGLCDKKNLFLNSTGGSTGHPLVFYQDENYLEWEKASAIRAWKYFEGFDKEELEAVFWGAERDIKKGLSIKGIIYNVLRNGMLPLNTFYYDSDLIIRYFLYYNFLKPKILRGYASSLFYMANFIEENNLKIHYPKAIISSAETLWPEMRKKIEKVFNSEIYDSYGSREVSQIATECSMHDGLHVVMENQYVEIVDKCIIVTNLNNYGMPFIRYKIGDLADGIVEGACGCGRHSMRLTRLRGRESDNISLPNGKVIHGEYFTHLFYGLFNVDSFLVEYRTKQNNLVIKCNKLTSEDKMSLKTRINEDLSFSNINFEKLDESTKTSTGKFKFIKVVHI